MQCPNGCSSSMVEEKRERLLHRNGEPIVVSDLTMYVCRECGQESMPLSSARIVEDVLNGVIKPSGEFVASWFEVGSVA